MRFLVLAVCAAAAACGGGKKPAPGSPAAATPLPPGDDPHRKLTADECGSFYDFMKQKGWLTEPGAQRDKVIAGCLEMGATAAFHECIFASTSREDADRCQ